MTIQELGSIGELVGAIATVATLIYLAVQIRQNSAVMERTVASAMRESTNEVTRILATDHLANQIFWEGIENRAGLSEKDRRIFDALLSLTLNSWREGYALGGRDHLSEQILSSGGNFLLTKPGVRDFWEEWKHQYTDEFAAIVTAKIEEHAAGS